MKEKQKSLLASTPETRVSGKTFLHQTVKTEKRDNHPTSISSFTSNGSPAPVEILPPSSDAPLEERGLIELPRNFPDTLDWWADQYFRFEVTTSNLSQKVQRRDIGLFLRFMEEQEKTLARRAWSPRLSRSFQTYMASVLDEKGHRRWGDKTINRVLAHMKTFAKWVHKITPFPLDNPMEKVKLRPLGTGLEIERAVTRPERRKLLDAADLLLKVGGISRDRKRYRKNPDRPRRSGYRPYRNRAIVYTLIETGMRRAAITHLNVDDVDWRRRVVAVLEKGGLTHEYTISQEGLAAIKDYMDLERNTDAERWDSSALFLTPASNPHGNGRLTERVVNTIWNEIAHQAGIEDKTPHSARHAMGRHIMEKTGNVAAVQRQLGHKNATYSMQYARITAEEMRKVVDERE